MPDRGNRDFRKMYINSQNIVMALSGATNNWISAGKTAATRTGTAKNDQFHGIKGDVLIGGAGDDIYTLWNPNVTVIEKGGEGVDTIEVQYYGTIKLPDNIENVILSHERATGATGNALANLMIAGKTGATLDGGAGNDVLVGGAGADVFRVQAGNGSDVIYNFQSGWDAVNLSGYGFTSFAQILAKSVQAGTDVVVKLNSSETLTLRNMSLKSLTAADFNMPLNTPAPVATDKLLTQAGQGWNSNGWFVVNNAWGSSALTAGVDYTLNSAFSTSDMTRGTTFNWSYPLTTTDQRILAYPELIFGTSPHNAAGNPTDTSKVFPVQVSNLSKLTVDYDLSYTGNKGGFNVAYDIWFANSPTATGTSAVTTELMIWLHKGGFEPGGTAVGTYTNGDFSATIYHTGTYTALVADKEWTKGSIDIADIVSKLKTMGIMSDSEYLRSIELGAEVASGTGSMTINGLQINVETKDANGVSKAMSIDGTGATLTQPSDAVKPVPPIDLLDTSGRVIGTQKIELSTTDKTIVSKYDIGGNFTGSDVTTKEKGYGLVQHFDRTYKLASAEKIMLNADGSTQTIFYDGNWVMKNATKVTTDAKGQVTTQYYDAKWMPSGMDIKVDEGNGSTMIKHYDAKWALTGAERVVVSGNITTTYHFDTSWKYTGIDKLIVNSDGSRTYQHLDAASKLQSYDVVKLADGVETTTHYNSKNAITGIDKMSARADGVLVTQSYDASNKLIQNIFVGTDLGDKVVGSATNAHIYLGLGSDTFSGSSGVENIHFNTAIGNGDVDTLLLFNSTKDKIVLHHDIFDQIGVGNLASSAFVKGTMAMDADDRIIYDSATGSLYYDPDGSGSAQQILFAHITPTSGFGAGNFVIM
ncbi:hypothetical protein SAMIE_1032000 [Sphingobium amiense]|uniref:Uncharacterized protein n=2 Tax=Sphingobium amiense TaxID=135719 RepID=A0A494WG64_9SPHN|nr:hypothetical protein SAMIE_1032000 [Sphingobium amiense]